MNPTTSNTTLPAPIPHPADPGIQPCPFDLHRARPRLSPADDGDGFPQYSYPSPGDIAEDILSWLDDHDSPAVLDPDARAWLRYEPSEGKFSTVAGTAEQVARVFIREAAAVANPKYDRIADLLTGDGPEIRGMYFVLDGNRPTMDQIARAMVDISVTAERAADTRKRLAAGRAPDVLSVPAERHVTSGLAWWESYEVTLTDCGYGECSHPDDAVFLRAARYHPEPDVPTPAFDALCAAVWPDPLVRDAALRSLSMGFTGRATKYVIYWRSETGRGKSIMAALMKDLLGDYARTVPAKTLFGYAADPQRAAQEIAGTWLAVVEEGIGSASFKADEAFKAVTTGGGDLNARKLYAESRQEAATHTILLAVNPEADMNYTDPAIMTRLCPIQFDGDPAEIAGLAAQCNPQTTVWKAEAPAVLARMMNYAREFWNGWKPYTLADIMGQPQAIGAGDDLVLAVDMRTATNVGTWLTASRRQFRTADTYRARDLYDHYRKWAAMRGEDAVTETMWGREVAKCGETVVKLPRTAAGVCYQFV